MKILNKKEKREILKRLEKEFGIREIEGVMVRFGKKKIRVYSGGLTKKELITLDKELGVESIGLYLLSFEGNNLRLSFDATLMFKNQINKNILEINKEEMKEWLKGNDLEIKEVGKKMGFKVIKAGEEFLGCGKVGEKKITNFVPKERRLKK